MTRILLTSQETQMAGSAYAEILLDSKFINQIITQKKAWIIFLEGELGAGKTTWVQGFLKRLGYTGRIKSPTYSFVEIYQSEQLNKFLPVYHFDLYRLPENLNLESACFLDIGLWEALDQPAICLIEWPSRVRAELLKPDVKISLKDDLATGGRQLEIKIKK
jgi:tRNA threonylcarbamoyladenosine biosynthesis protein TsaE